MSAEKNNNIQFLTQGDVQGMLLDHPYFGTMTTKDLRARSWGQMTSGMDAHQYKLRYVMSIVPFTEQEKQTLIVLVANANELLKPYNRISSIPWKFAKLCCDVENGLPHTLGDVIFLSDLTLHTGNPVPDPQRLTTLVHEKIHVYQRRFPLFAHLLVCKVWKYSIFDLAHKHVDARNNPDLNGIVYGKDNVGFYMAMRPTASSLGDASIKFVSIPDRDGKKPVPKQKEPSETYEHPFERMAYQLSETIVAGTKPDADLGRWMRSYF